MKLKKSLQALVVLSGLLAVSGAQADVVSCGDLSLGVRTATVDPGLSGGFCYAQNGNFAGDNFSAVSTALGSTLTLRGKEIAANGDVATPLIDFTGSTSGTWSVASSLWTTYSRVFLAFHFGGGGNSSIDNPDSFVVELARADTSGTWALGPIGTAQLTGLSNIYVLSEGTCTSGCGGGPNNVPEPASLALVGLALAGAGLVRRRKA